MQWQGAGEAAASNTQDDHSPQDTIQNTDRTPHQHWQEDMHKQRQSEPKQANTKTPTHKHAHNHKLERPTPSDDLHQQLQLTFTRDCSQLNLQKEAASSQPAAAAALCQAQHVAAEWSRGVQQPTCTARWQAAGRGIASRDAEGPWQFSHAHTHSHHRIRICPQTRDRDSDTNACDCADGNFNLDIC